MILGHTLTKIYIMSCASSSYTLQNESHYSTTYHYGHHNEDCDRYHTAIESHYNMTYHYGCHNEGYDHLHTAIVITL